MQATLIPPTPAKVERVQVYSPAALPTKQPPTLQQQTPYRFVIEAILFLTYLSFGISWIAITPLVNDLKAEFHVGSAQLALANTMVSVAKIVVPLLTGLVAVRLGLKRTILLGSSCIALSAVVPFAPNFSSFLAARFLFGIGGAVVVTLFAPMVMQWFPAGEIPIVNGFNSVAVNTGITITLFTTVPLAAAVGWRRTLLGYGLLSVALLVAWALFGRDRQAVPADHKTEVADTLPQFRYRDVWKRRETWIISICAAGPLALYLAFNTWLPTYYMEAFGLPKAVASHFTGLFNLAGIPTAIAAGFLTKKLGARLPLVIGAGMVMGFAALGMVFLHHTTAIVISAILLGMALFTYVAPLTTLAMELPGMTSHHFALLMGTMWSVAYLVSSVSPVLVGLLKDATGSFQPGLAIFAALSWILVPGGLLLPETGPVARGQKNGMGEKAT